MLVQHGYFNAMYLSVSLLSMCKVPEILDGLDLHMLTNEAYLTIAKSCFSDEMLENFQDRWDFEAIRISDYLESAMECAEQCMDMESYKTYQKIMKKLLHVDFSYGNINKQFRKGVMTEWERFTEMISSEEPFKDKVLLINDIRESNLLLNTAKELLIESINTSYDWDDVLSNPSIVNKGYMPDSHALEELLLKYQKQQFNSLVEEISIAAGICFMSSVLGQDDVCMKYIKEYKSLLAKIPSSKVEFLALLRYELLPELWEKIGDFERSYVIYKHMYEGLLSKRWITFTYYESKLTKEIYDHMFRCIISMGTDVDCNEYNEVQKRYEKLCEELESNWDESLLEKYY